MSRGNQKTADAARKKRQRAALVPAEETNPEVPVALAYAAPRRCPHSTRQDVEPTGCSLCVGAIVERSPVPERDYALRGAPGTYWQGRLESDVPPDHLAARAVRERERKRELESIASREKIFRSSSETFLRSLGFEIAISKEGAE